MCLKTYYECVQWAKNLPLRTTDKMVLMILATHADETRSCYPTIRFLSKETDICTRQVRRCLKFLHDNEFISVQKVTVEGRKGERNMYTLNTNVRITKGEPVDNSSTNRERLSTLGGDCESPNTFRGDCESPIGLYINNKNLINKKESYSLTTVGDAHKFTSIDLGVVNRFCEDVKNQKFHNNELDAWSYHNQALYILGFMNARTDFAYEPTKHFLNLIYKLLDSGYKSKQLIQVVARKSTEWLGTSMEKNLTPSTLFSVKHFCTYVGQLGTEVRRDENEK